MDKKLFFIKVQKLRIISRRYLLENGSPFYLAYSVEKKEKLEEYLYPVAHFSYCVNGIEGTLVFTIENKQLIFKDKRIKVFLKVSDSIDEIVIEKELKAFFEKVKKKGKLISLIEPSNLLFNYKMHCYAVFGHWINNHIADAIFKHLVSKYGIEKVESIALEQIKHSWEPNYENGQIYSILVITIDNKNEYFYILLKKVFIFENVIELKEFASRKDAHLFHYWLLPWLIRNGFLPDSNSKQKEKNKEQLMKS